MLHNIDWGFKCETFAEQLNAGCWDSDIMKTAPWGYNIVKLYFRIFSSFKMSNFRDMMSSEESEHFMLAWDEFALVLINIK